MGMLKEFKEFAMRGSVVDLAVAVVIGGAFGKIVTSFVDDVLMPPLGYMIGGADFSDLKYVLQEGVASINADGVAEMTGEVAVSYGLFFNTIINFIIIAFAIFMVVKLINKLNKKGEEAPAEPTAEETLLTEIRDLLKKN